MSRMIELGDTVKFTTTDSSLGIVAGETGIVVDIDLEEIYPYTIELGGGTQANLNDEEVSLVEVTSEPEPVIGTTNPVALAAAEQAGATFHGVGTTTPAIETSTTEAEIQVFCPYCGKTFHVNI
jgi:hypothetical protein